MYMPGRLRTASSPSRTVIDRASYDKVETPPGTDTRGQREPPPPSVLVRLSFYLGVPSGSAVRVTRPAAIAHPPLPGPPRPGRAAHFHPLYRAIAEFGVDPAHQRGSDQADLCRPGRRVGGHGQLTAGEAVRPGVRRKLGADDLLPPAEHRARGGGEPPAAGVDQPVDGGIQRLRILPALPPP